jgi:hypothetical protein
MDATNTFHQLVKCYFRQLTVGCGAIFCPFAHCRSWKTFKTPPEGCDPTAAAIYAVQLAREHFKSPCLCPGPDPLAFRRDLGFLNAVNAKFKGCFQSSDQHTRDKLARVLSSYELFPFIVLHGDRQNS